MQESTTLEPGRMGALSRIRGMRLRAGTAAQGGIRVEVRVGVGFGVGVEVRVEVRWRERRFAAHKP